MNVKLNALKLLFKTSYGCLEFHFDCSFIHIQKHQASYLEIMNVITVKFHLGTNVNLDGNSLLKTVGFIIAI